MTFKMVHRYRAAAGAACALAVVAFWQPAIAQDVSESHLAAARATINALEATDDFDDILPQAALALKNELIQKNPDLQAVINEVVDAKAIGLASRRADLEREAALVYAKAFTETELNEMTTFYNSPTGKKVMDSGPIVAREIIQAADIWQRGIARDLAAQVGEELDKRYAANQPPAEGEGGSEGQAEGQ